MASLFHLSGCKKSPISPGADVLDRPVIWLSSSVFSFAASQTGPNPSPQTFQIKNSGKGTLKYSVSCDTNWLSVEPASGTSAGDLKEHAVSIDKSGLTPQDNDYVAAITITCQEAYNNPQKIKVNLKLSKEPPPEISVTPNTLSFVAQVGGSNPTAQTMSIRNSGQSTLNYTVSDDATWLDVSPTSGSSTGETKTHTVTVNSGGLAEGSYAATITVSDPNASNNPQSVSVSLLVSKQLPPVIQVNTASLSFVAQVGGSNPSPQTIGIRNGGGGTLSYAITWNPTNWLSVSPTNGSSTGQENTHTVSVSSGGLGLGTYNGTITVASSGASNSPQIVSVTLLVTSVPTNNQISVSCNPSQAYTNTTVSFPISIYGNTKAISSFGLQLTYDTNMFTYVGTGKGGLTGDWAYIDGNDASGTVTVGGFAGSGTTVPIGSSGTIAVVTLRVTGGTYPNGQTSQITIRSYADDIAGMTPQPATTTFTYRK